MLNSIIWLLTDSDVDKEWRLQTSALKKIGFCYTIFLTLFLEMMLVMMFIDLVF